MRAPETIEGVETVIAAQHRTGQDRPAQLNILDYTRPHTRIL